MPDAPLDPRDAAAREERRLLSRKRILESAHQVFFRDGFMAANLDDVAHRAGVAKGTLYRYFESKAELYVAVLARDGAIFEQKLRDTVSPAFTPAEQIRRTGRFYLEHWTQNREYFQIFWAIENQLMIGGLPPAVIDEVRKLWEQCLQILAGIIERGVRQGVFRPCDAWQMANVLWILANGLLQTEFTPTRQQLLRSRLENAFQDAIDVFLRGLAA
jgi:TetR/AcrR family fatty acid metabolism transcriptional regulator